MKGPARETHPELLAALGKLRMSDRAIERAAGVRQAFVSGLRRGEGGSAKALRSIGKLLALLESKGITAKSSATQVKASGRASRASSSDEIPEQLARLVDDPRDQETIGRALSMATAMCVRGILDRFTLQALESALKTRSSVLEREHMDKARRDSSRPTVVRVEFVDDWRTEPAAEDLAEDEKT